MHVSALNRSCGVALDSQVVEALATDIEVNGLINPITLLQVFKDSEETYDIVAGAHRHAALVRLRGIDGRLSPDEYRLLNADTPPAQILAISMAENAKRTASSAYGESLYIARLLEHTEFIKDEIGKVFGRSRHWVTAAERLVERWAELPESWRKDLSTVPDTEGKDPVIISFTHFAEGARHLPASPLTARDVRYMDNCRDKRYSARILGNALARHFKFFNDGDEPQSSAPDMPEAPAPDVAAELEHTAILEALKTALGYSATDYKLTGIIEKAITRVNKLKAGSDLRKREQTEMMSGGLGKGQSSTKATGDPQPHAEKQKGGKEEK